ncbi:hypothetical protein FOPG_20140 [Fusarium oxysporum f. sp. conglutinans race 2 54008]|uniref:Uncharacterized protein n=1 Tax=Fusarium oxysporum f. sp. conglutinans race 2 54008 TaxID=1089457 RepID=X0GIW0_FUSOX|nr:hypothetical protein FOPG_20140 [Fusarium oxysporum f. sp. conglutinans race 2 54008]
MNNMFRLFQLNVRKQGSAHESLINHKDIRDAAVLAIQEPQARQIQGKLLTVPMGHHGWLKMVLVTEREGRWVIQSIPFGEQRGGGRAGVSRVLRCDCGGHSPARASGLHGVGPPC